LHHFYKTLSNCRKNNPALITGATYILPIQSDGVMAYLRFNESNVILIILNVSHELQKIAFAHELITGTFKNIFSGLAFEFNKEVAFELMPGDYFVYVK
ncbi:MAG: alpha-glucosidase C-terminal domain-containing protein, partial [Sediminibacterium sp.]